MNLWEQQRASKIYRMHAALFRRCPSCTTRGVSVFILLSFLLLVNIVHFFVTSAGLLRAYASGIRGEESAGPLGEESGGPPGPSPGSLEHNMTYSVIRDGGSCRFFAAPPPEELPPDLEVYPKCSYFSINDARAWANAPRHLAMDELIPSSCPTATSNVTLDASPSSARLLSGLHVGWFGNANQGDDIMSPLFALVLQQALLLELPHLRGTDVSVVSCDCSPNSAKMDFVRRKHFWVLGGGSVIEFLTLDRLSAGLITELAARAEPLFIFGAGYQYNEYDGFHNFWTETNRGLITEFLNVYGRLDRTPRLLFGGVRGQISANFLNSLASEGIAPIEVTGDPGFLAHLMDNKTDDELVRSLFELPPYYIVSTCYENYTQAVETTVALALRHNFDVLILAISEFPPRSMDTLAFERTLKARGVRVRTMWLGHPFDTSVVLDLLRIAAAGVHCTLHGALMQLSVGKPAFMYGGFKLNDALSGSALAEDFVLLDAQPDSAHRVMDAIHYSSWIPKVQQFRERVLERQLSAMRDFVRNLIRDRYPEVGLILDCAVGFGKGTSLEIRTYVEQESATIELVLKGIDA